MDSTDRAYAVEPFRGREVAPARRRPDCFKPTAVLFSGSGFENSYDQELDRLRAGMLDGRTVHFHFQFVEPELLERYPLAVCQKPGLVAGSLSPRSLSEARMPLGNDLQQTEFECSFGNMYAILSRAEFVALHRGQVEAALAELAHVGLDWLPALSIGGFAFRETTDLQPPFWAMVPFRSEPEELATCIVEQSAASLARMWIEAEAHVGHHEIQTVSSALSLASAVLASLLKIEFQLRKNGERTSATPSSRLEEVLADFPLTRHLISFWDPRWDRQAYLKGSPFDHAPTLTALYEGWRA